MLQFFQVPGGSVGDTPRVLLNKLCIVMLVEKCRPIHNNSLQFNCLLKCFQQVKVITSSCTGANNSHIETATYLFIYFEF